LNRVLDRTVEKGNIVCKSKQIWAYTVDIVLITRILSLKEIKSAPETE
jgi:hypothetical protein